MFSIDRSLTETSTPYHFKAWKSKDRRPLYVSSRCVGVNQLIPTFIPPGPDGPSENAKINSLGCEPVVQLRYTLVPPPPVPNPLCSTVKALATLFPSGERDSADHVVSAPPLMQPDSRKQTPRINGKIIWMMEEQAPLPGSFISPISSPFKSAGGAETRFDFYFMSHRLIYHSRTILCR